MSLGSPKQYARANAVDFKNIPEELKSMAQWECWRMTEGRKVPIDAHTGQPYPRNAFSSEQMGTATFAEACECFARDRSLLGIGFRFKKTDPYCGVDLDNCRDLKTGSLQSWAADLITQFSSYTEVSPSETGVKVIVRGKIPSAVTKTNEIEMYCNGRYFALTGHSLKRGHHTAGPGPIGLVAQTADDEARETGIVRFCPRHKMGIRWRALRTDSLRDWLAAQARSQHG